MPKQSETEHEFAERLSRAYDVMLERAIEAFDAATQKTESFLEHAVETASRKALELGELTYEEAHNVKDYLVRDVHDAARYLAEHERELADWLRLDLLLVETRVSQSFANAVERARSDLKHLSKTTGKLFEWHTGEITAIGALSCKGCGKSIHFHRTGRIPPCSRCRGTVFTRVKD
jgi:hypothetical protein